MEMTQREIDVLECMVAGEMDVLSGEKRRINISPAAIRDNLTARHPGIKVHHVVASQQNLEKFGLIVRITDAGTGEIISGRRQVSTFELNEDLYLGLCPTVVKKHKSGYKPGTYKKPAVEGDKAKKIVRRAKELLEEKKSQFAKLNKSNQALRTKLVKQEQQAKGLWTDIQIIAELLSLRERNLRTWERKKKNSIKDDQ